MIEAGAADGAGRRARNQAEARVRPGAGGGDRAPGVAAAVRVARAARPGAVAARGCAPALAVAGGVTAPLGWSAGEAGDSLRPAPADDARRLVAADPRAAAGRVHPGRLAAVRGDPRGTGARGPDRWRRRPVLRHGAQPGHVPWACSRTTWSIAMIDPRVGVRGARRPPRAAGWLASVTGRVRWGLLRPLPGAGAVVVVVFFAVELPAAAVDEHAGAAPAAGTLARAAGGDPAHDAAAGCRRGGRVPGLPHPGGVRRGSPGPPPGPRTRVVVSAVVFALAHGASGRLALR